jgi:hypothetical protein
MLLSLDTFFWGVNIKFNMMEGMCSWSVSKDLIVRCSLFVLPQTLSRVVIHIKDVAASLCHKLFFFLREEL